LDLYQQLQIAAREYPQNPPFYGKSTQLVGDVRISGFGPQDRRIVTFNTTHVAAPYDRSIRATSYVVDLALTPEQLKDPARKRNFVVGESEKGLTILGTHEQLLGVYGEDLFARLLEQGFVQVGEIHALDIDRDTYESIEE
jgi:hypothetical protein